MANKQLSAVITIGGAVASSLHSAFGTVTAGTDKIGAAVQKLESRQRELNRVVREQEKLGTAGSALKAEYATKELAFLDKKLLKLKQVQAQEQRTATLTAENQARRASMGSMIGAGAVTVAAFAAPIIQAAQFEKAMLGVAKQVQGARDSGGQLTPVYFEMAQQIRLMGREIPLATNDLAEMVAAGARMGIAKDELIEFTRTSAMMASAFDIDAASLADSMGKIAGIFHIPIKDVAELGDAINYLDDNAISKGSDIIKVMQGDLAGAASTMGLSAKNAAALASTFLTLGESAERADTAASGMLRQLQIAKMNPARFQAGLKMIGMTGDQLQKGMVKDTQGTVLKVLDALNKLPKEKQMEAVTRLFGKDWGGAIAKLAGGVGEYRRQLELANGAAAKGSMSREFQAQRATTLAQWQLMKNQVSELAGTVGSVLLPSLNQFLTVVGQITAQFADFARENPRLIENLTTLAGVFVAFGGVKLAITGVVWAFNALKIAVMTNPIGLALTLLAGAAVLIYQNWEPIKEFFSTLWEGVKDATSSAFEWVKQLWLDYTPIGFVVKNWGPITEFFGTLWEGIKQAANTAFEWVKQLWLDFTPIGLVVKNWEPIREFFTNLWADIVASASQAFEWIFQKIDAIGQAWQNTKSFFGFGDETAGTKPAGAPAAALPAPAMATARGGGSNYQDNSQTTIQVTQQPGEDGRALAKRLAEEQERQRRVRQRGLMLDGATAQ